MAGEEGTRRSIVNVCQGFIYTPLTALADLWPASVGSLVRQFTSFLEGWVTFKCQIALCGDHVALRGRPTLWFEYWNPEGHHRYRVLGNFNWAVSVKYASNSNCRHKTYVRNERNLTATVLQTVCKKKIKISSLMNSVNRLYTRGFLFSANRRPRYSEYINMILCLRLSVCVLRRGKSNRICQTRRVDLVFALQRDSSIVEWSTILVDILAATYSRRLIRRLRSRYINHSVSSSRTWSTWIRILKLKTSGESSWTVMVTVFHHMTLTFSQCILQFYTRLSLS